MHFSAVVSLKNERLPWSPRVESRIKRQAGGGSMKFIFPGLSHSLPWSIDTPYGLPSNLNV